jgi:hypothetical protein
MGSRLFPLSCTLGALVADATGAHKAAFYLVLLAIVGAAAAAFLGAGEALEGAGSWLRAVSTGLALALLVLGSAVRANAPHGAGVPALAVSALAAALFAYALPLFVWLLAAPGVRLREAVPDTAFGEAVPDTAFSPGYSSRNRAYPSR